MLPYDSEVECKKYIVVYDGTTDSLENKGKNFCSSVLFMNRFLLRLQLVTKGLSSVVFQSPSQLIMIILHK